MKFNKGSLGKAYPFVDATVAPSSYSSGLQIHFANEASSLGVVFRTNFSLQEKLDVFTLPNAIRNADSVNNLRLKIKLEGGAVKSRSDFGSTYDQVEFGQ